jgi:hypothetical protein
MRRFDDVFRALTDQHVARKNAQQGAVRLAQRRRKRDDAAAFVARRLEAEAHTAKRLDTTRLGRDGQRDEP